MHLPIASYLNEEKHKRKDSQLVVYLFKFHGQAHRLASVFEVQSGVSF